MSQHPRLLLVRHAMPTIRPDAPGADWRLSPKGRAGAAALAEEPYWADLSVIHTSSEPKAIGTAQRIAAHHGLRILIEDGLREVGGRPWTGEGYSELGRRYLAGEPVGQWEPAEAALARVRDCIDGIVARSEGSDAALVSHGLALTLYLADLLGLDADASFVVWSGMRLPDVAIIDPAARRVARQFGIESGPRT